MNWAEAFPQDHKPDISEIKSYIASPLWDTLCSWIETTFSVTPTIEYSVCKGALGWNIKYKRKSKSLCTLYPDKNKYIALIVIGSKEVEETEDILPLLNPTIQGLYQNTRSFNKCKWLMIVVDNQEILENVKTLIHIRSKSK